MSDHVSRFYIWMTRHDPRVFVPKCDYVTALGTRGRDEIGVPGGGPRYCISPLAIMDFAPDSGRMRLHSVHPGTTVDDVIAATGFELVIPREVLETPSPSAEDLALLRERVDWRGALRHGSVSGSDLRHRCRRVSGAAMHPRMEFLSAAQLRLLQTRKLRALLQRAAACDGYYRRLLRRARVDPDRVRDVEDVRRIPFSAKADLIADQEAHPPFGSRLLVDDSEVARLSLSGGSSGRGRELIAHTRQDLLVLGGLQATGFRWGGMGADDTIVFHIPATNATASLAFPYGIEATGRLMYLVGASGFAERLELMRTYGVSGVFGTPSTINGLTAELEGSGSAPRELFGGVRRVFVSGEPFGTGWAQRIQRAWRAPVSEGYGSTQTHGGQCMATCSEGVASAGRRGGMHVFDWSFITEILEPGGEEPVERGATGELVVTTLDKRAAPAIRYRTGDRVRRLERPCPCGRETELIESGTIGRLDDMLKVKGVNLWPDAADECLLGVVGLDEFQAEVVIGERGRDEIELRVAAAPGHDAADVGAAAVTAFKRGFGITVRIRAVARSELTIGYGDGGKARRWSDLRGKALGV